MKPAAASENIPPKGRGRRRFLLFFLLVLIAMVTFGPWLFLRHLTEVALWFANRASPQFEVEMSEVEFLWPASARINGLRLLDREARAPLVEVDSAMVHWGWRALFDREIRSIELHRPIIKVNLDAFETALAEAAPVEGAAGPPWLVRHFGVRDGGVEALLQERWQAAFHFDASFRELLLSPDFPKSDALQTVALGNLTVRDLENPERDPLSVRRLEVAIRFPDLVNGQIEHLKIYEPALDIYPELWAGLLREDGAGAGAAPAWTPQVMKLEIYRGRATATAPELGLDSLEARFEVTPQPGEAPFDHQVDMTGALAGRLIDRYEAALDFALRMEGLPGDASALLAEETQELVLSGFRIIDREHPALAPLTMEKATVAFRLPQLMELQLDRLSIEEGRLRLHSDLWTGLGDGEPGDGGLREAVIPHIELLEWTGGRVTLRDPSGRLPGASADFTIGPSDQPGRHRLAARHLELHTELAPWSPFLKSREIDVIFAVERLLRERRVDEVMVSGLNFTIGDDLQFLMRMGDEPAAPDEEVEAERELEETANPTPPVVIDLVRLRDARFRLTDLGHGIPDITFYMRTDMTDVPLSTAVAASEVDAVELVEISELTIFSPLDPFMPVVSFHAIFVRFTIPELLNRELREISIISPTLYIGEDLFWYVDEVRRRGEEMERPTGADEPSWKIDQFELSSGQMVLSSAGSPRLALPMSFNTRATNLDFADFTTLQLELDLVVPEEDYLFPDYQLELLRLSGDIQFGLPPGEDAKNIVNVLNVAEVNLRQFSGDDFWLSLTYDESGIYGEFGGNAYQGYLNGGFNFYWDDRFSWIGWVAGTGVELLPVTNIMAPENFLMDGRTEFTLEASGLSTEIDRVAGRLALETPGELDVTQLERLLADLPEEWSGFRKSLTILAVETLQKFKYDSGTGSFWYSHRAGQLDLALKGPYGSREFEVVLHNRPPGESPFALDE